MSPEPQYQYHLINKCVPCSYEILCLQTVQFVQFFRIYHEQKWHMIVLIFMLSVCHVLWQWCADECCQYSQILRSLTDILLVFPLGVPQAMTYDIELPPCFCIQECPQQCLCPMPALWALPRPC